MTTYSIPVPIGGGDFDLSADRTGMINLGDGRFMVMFFQNFPNNLMVQIFEYNHLSEPTVFDAYLISGNIRDLSGAHGDVVLMNPDGSGKVLIVYQTTNDTKYAFLSFTSDNQISIGTTGSMLEVTDSTSPVFIAKLHNNLWRTTYFRREGSGSGTVTNFGVRNLNVNGVAETLQVTTSGYRIEGTASNTGFQYYEGMKITRIPGTSKYYVNQIRRNHNGQYIGALSVILNQDGTLNAVVPSAITPFYRPMADNKFVNVTANNSSVFLQYTIDDDFNLSSSLILLNNDIRGDGLEFKVSYPVYGVSDFVALSETHALVLLHNNRGTNLGIGNLGTMVNPSTNEASDVKAIVFRFITDDTIEVSLPSQPIGIDLTYTIEPSEFFTSTQNRISSENLRVPLINRRNLPPGANFNLNSFFQMATDTILHFFISQNQLCYKVLYQSGS